MEEASSLLIPADRPKYFWLVKHPNTRLVFQSPEEFKGWLDTQDKTLRPFKMFEFGILHSLTFPKKTREFWITNLSETKDKKEDWVNTNVRTWTRDSDNLFNYYFNVMKVSLEDDVRWVPTQSFRQVILKNISNSMATLENIVQIISK